MIGGIRITKRVRERAILAYTSIGLRAYLCERNEWTEEAYDSIDWLAMWKAMESKMHDFHVRIVKLQHDWLNVGLQRAKIRPSTSDACPCCGAAGERTLHLLTCGAEVM